MVSNYIEDSNYICFVSSILGMHDDIFKLTQIYTKIRTHDLSALIWTAYNYSGQ